MTVYSHAATHTCSGSYIARHRYDMKYSGVRLCCCTQAGHQFYIGGTEGQAPAQDWELFERIEKVYRL